MHQYSWDYFCHSLKLHTVSHGSNNTICFSFCFGPVHIMFSAKPYFPIASFLIFHVCVSSIFPGFVLWPSCDCSPGSHSNIRWCTSIFVLNHCDRWSACIALYFSFPPSTSQVAPKDIRPAGFLTSLPWWKSWKSTLTKLHSDNAEPVNHHQHPHSLSGRDRLWLFWLWLSICARLWLRKNLCNVILDDTLYFSDHITPTTNSLKNTTFSDDRICSGSCANPSYF